MERLIGTLVLIMVIAVAGSPAWGGEADAGATKSAGSTGVKSEEVDFGPYMADLQRRIKRSWFPPMGKESKRVVVAFKIHKGGELSHLRIDWSSGIAVADQAALRAVEAASPFRPLPLGAPDDVDIQFTFDYNVFGGPSGGTQGYRAFSAPSGGIPGYKPVGRLAPIPFGYWSGGVRHSWPSVDAVQEKPVEKPAEKTPPTPPASSAETASSGWPSVRARGLGDRSYLQSIEAAIKKKWSPPKGKVWNVCKTSFKVDRNGAATDLKIQRSSDDAVVDRATLQTIELAAPFKPLPSGAPEEIELEVWF